MGDPRYCDHAHVDWSQNTTRAGGRDFQTNKFRCPDCNTEVRINDTPQEIAARRRVVKEAGRGEVEG